MKSPAPRWSSGPSVGLPVTLLVREWYTLSKAPAFVSSVLEQGYQYVEEFIHLFLVAKIPKSSDE